MNDLTIFTIVATESNITIGKKESPESYLPKIKKALVKMKAELEMHRRKSCESCLEYERTLYQKGGNNG